MDNNFFNKPEENMEEQGQEEQKIKLGEKEYTQDELSELVGLGELGREMQSQYNTDFKKVWPNHQKLVQEKQELERKLAEATTPKPEPKPESDLTEEDLLKQAVEKLEAQGVITERNFQNKVAQIFAARDLIDETGKVISENVNNGNPNVSVDELLAYMDETGVKSPEKAYKLRFENELEKIKESKLASIKQPGMVTQPTSNAGGKVPEAVKITRDNLQSLMNEVIARG